MTYEQLIVLALPLLPLLGALLCVFLGPKKYVLHLVPSGILRKKKICVIGNGVVVDPVNLVEEILGLIRLGIKVDGNLLISETSHLVFPYHRELANA